MSCRNSKVTTPEPVMEMENFTDVIIEDGITPLDSLPEGQEGNVEIIVTHKGMDQQKIDSIKTVKNKQKKVK